MSVKPTTAPAVPEKRITLVYLGKHWDGKEIDHQYQEAKETDGLDTWSLVGDVKLYKKSLMTCQPGGMFSIAVNPEKEGSVYVNTCKWICPWPDEAKRVEWIATSNAVAAAYMQKVATEKEMKDNAAVERLEPFKAVYRRSNAAVRRQILAEIIRYITT
jgi:hypothetical protein